jgi:hypothetical protein
MPSMRPTHSFRSLVRTEQLRRIDTIGGSQTTNLSGLAPIERGEGRCGPVKPLVQPQDKNPIGEPHKRLSRLSWLPFTIVTTHIF